MYKRSSISNAATVLLVLVALGSACASYCNVKDYGAKGDGKANDTEPFIKAFEACKGSQSPSTIFVPPGKYSVWPLALKKDQCSDLIFDIEGTMMAPSDPAAYQWVKNESYLLFKECNNLVIQGGGKGVVDGQGMTWWAIGGERPYLCKIDDSENVMVLNITLQNSPMFHLVPEGSKNIMIDRITILAPSKSPNTDGIDPSGSENVTIINSMISTGDDNVAVKGGCKHILVENCYFGSGHGCSIGSIRDSGVEDVTLRNITFVGTENGARIKTWQGGTATIQNINYINLRMKGVELPIDINMYYCPGGGCKNQTKGVTIKDILFSDISGTQTKGKAGQIYCSDTVPCTSISMKDIDIQPISSSATNTFSCWRAFGESSNVSPPSCLMDKELEMMM